MKKQARGFAVMSAQVRRKIASMGGKAVHKQGTGHEFTSAEARKAGRIGGHSVSRDKKYMSQIGKRGSLARRRKK